MLRYFSLTINSDLAGLSTFARLIPFLTVLIAAFAVYQLVAAVLFAARMVWGFAALYTLLSVAGFALARTLWMHRKRFAPPP